MSMRLTRVKRGKYTYGNWVIEHVESSYWTIYFLINGNPRLADWHTTTPTLREARDFLTTRSKTDGRHHPDA